MKQILILVITLCAFSLSAKKPKVDYPRAEIKVSYNWHGTSAKRDGTPRTYDYDYLLLTNPSESKFYNVRNEYLDSLDSTPSGRVKSREMMTAALDLYREKGDESAIPKRKGFMYVFKSFPKSETTMYDNCGLGEYGYYTEPHSEIAWQLGDSTKNILGYDCKIAETDYHGRHWTAWFATDIPLQDGPWKLCGLPGLILEAYESDGLFSFTATGIERSDKEMFPVYQNPYQQYARRTRIEMLRDYAAYCRKQGTITAMIINGNPDGTKYIDDTPKPSSQVAPPIDFLETEYH